MNVKATSSRKRTWGRRAATTLAAMALGATAVISPAQAAPVGSLDHLGRPAPHVLNQIEQFANTPGLPDKAKSALESVVGFFRGDGDKDPGVYLPEGGPAFTQFAFPSVSMKCIGGKDKAVGTAMAVPGPAALPLPGVAHGEVNFVFTALGTGPAAKKQAIPMRVHWVNINNGRIGTTVLGNNGINPKGPGTVNGAAKTGSGTVVALLEGGVTTVEKNSGPSNCGFSPTVAMINVR